MTSTFDNLTTWKNSKKISFLLKCLSVILAIFTCFTLFIPLIMGHKITDTTFVWIKISGWDIIWFEPIMIFAFVAPVLASGAMLDQYPIVIKKNLLIGLLSLLASLVYMFSLTMTWGDLLTNISQNIRLCPSCLMYPLSSMIHMLISILAVCFEPSNDEMDNDFLELNKTAALAD